MKNQLIKNQLIKLLVRLYAELSGKQAYARYLHHHAQHHADTPPLSRVAFYRHQQDKKWGGISRCC